MLGFGTFRLKKPRKIKLPTESPPALRARRLYPLTDLVVQLPSNDTYTLTPTELVEILARWGVDRFQAESFVDYVGSFFAAHLDVGTGEFCWVPPEEVPTSFGFGTGLPIR